MSSLKLGVEVVQATELPAKDGQGGTNAYVELEFDGQRHRTSVKDKDVNPYWNERFYFAVADPAALRNLALEAFVYHLNRATKKTSCIGKVRIDGISFAGFADATTLYYPLEKKTFFSRVRGELGLKVYLTDDPSVMASIPAPEMETLLPGDAAAAVSQSQALAREQEAANSVLNPFNASAGATPARRFNHLPRDQLQNLPLPRPLSRQSQQHFAAAGAAGEMPIVGVDRAGQYISDEARAEGPRLMKMFSSAATQPVDFQIKETSPRLGGGRVVGGRVIAGDKAGVHDLVERMHYLFVRVVKARDLPTMDVTGSLDPYVEVRLGNYRLKTRYFEKNQRPEWDEVFAFPQERVQSSVVEVFLMDKDLVRDDFVGLVRFDLNEVPTRVPPDSPLAPEWYRLEGKRGERNKGELMLAVWIGTQADECFPIALHADSAPVEHSLTAHIRGKVYPVPRLWYLRVGIIEAQDAVVSDRRRLPEVFVKVSVGGQMLRTRPSRSQTASFVWNEELMFVVAEPFEDDLVVAVEDRTGPNKDEVIGHVEIPLSSVPKRGDIKDYYKDFPSAWFDLRRPGIDLSKLMEDKFATKIHLRLCLEGGYHVLDESTQYASDFRPTMKQLWKPPIGLLELGILGADGLHPMKTRDGRGTCDAYCVAKYGCKWVRTRTIVDNLSPRFNEQYTWDVYDHGTVLTVGVFDNCHLNERPSSGANPASNGHHRDSIIGKVRIRLSTLETGRVYTNSYPLITLHSSGVKKMGELHLAIRFTSTSLLNIFLAYTRPLLPKMHYVRPLSMMQQDMLRHQAVQIVAQRLGRMEPPVRKEVVEFMSDAHSHLFSMRKSKANFFRLMSVFSGAIAASRWLGDVCQWKNPITTVLVHVLFAMLVCYPDLILPTVFLYMFLIGLWNYRFRPRYPPHMNTRISHADAIPADELDEEFDTFPSTRSPEQIRHRYDRLRHVAGKIQTAVGDVASQGERMQSLVSWRDPRATAMFLVFCLGAAVTLYVTPFKVVALALGFYAMRHPRFRQRLPMVPVNFFRRLPAKTDSLL